MSISTFLGLLFLAATRISSSTMASKKGEARAHLPIFLSLSYILQFCIAKDTITTTQYIRDPETVISTGGKFKLGFFSPGNSTNRYVGICYNDIPGQTIVWVANSENPLTDSSGVVKTADNGNLVVLDGQKNVVWWSNVSNIAKDTSAELLDSGNLVLQQEISDDGTNMSTVIWKSFDHPSDTIIPFMKLSGNMRTNEKLLLRSWKGVSDPSTGSFSFGLLPMKIPEVFIWNGSRPLWRSGPWNSLIFIGVANMDSGYPDGIIFNRDLQEGSVYFTSATDVLVRVVLDSQGNLARLNWEQEKNEWVVHWSAPETECDTYGKCGPFGSCNALDSPISESVWQIQKSALSGFFSWFLTKSFSSCLVAKNKKSSIFKIFSDKRRDHKLIIITTVVTGMTAMGVFTYFSLKWMAKQRGRKKVNMNMLGDNMPLFDQGETSRKLSDAKMLAKNIKQGKEPKVPLFNFEKLAKATNNFNEANKLGKGGFGEVYKGKLLNGQEIAVKRLSKSSGQGIEEFINEVVVISKLQHRNLVRLFGCCIEGAEKMLIYEYMPNKSLDAFLFDLTKATILGWRERYRIIEGICRGLLYLHRDSRFRIIHRDLKASNILLDKELDPKISDFGMARIFGGTQDEANTRRVVGTYGYMSPEYAMKGQFSEKSDVFSFGVLLLEIVSGKKNTSFNHHHESLSLLEYAWKLWNENKIMELIDQPLYVPSFHTDILRCIHVGLLCIQELTKDRPTVSTIISMLSSEIAVLPTPKQPAFIERQSDSYHQKSHNMPSINDVSITVIEGR